MITDWNNLVPKEKIIKWRRQLHQNPELSFEEYNTSQFIFDTLATFPNLELTRPTETSVVATLKGGAGEGQTIALRADMDALPIKEETDVKFKSKNQGVMHACGHDTHVAMLLGAAKVLTSMKDNLAGTVKFIFQHAEEQVPGGAQQIIDAGVLKDVDEIYGIHILPTFKKGSIGIVDGAATIAADGFYLKIQGKGSHASTPELAIDPIIVGSELVTALQTIRSRSVKSSENAIISIGEFISGQAPNIIADTAKLSCSIRSFNEKTRDLVEKRVREIVEHVTKAHGASYELNYIRGYSPVINNHELAVKAKQAAINVLGEELVYDANTLMASEDFSAYTKVVPGCFMFLGAGTEEDGIKYFNHNPKFDVLEESMFNGTKVEVQVILDLLGRY
ncbi:N-acyl-L-amino acid amidohydrolase [Paraliobacillus sp. PM-2]|uniref:M20 metallopeptidase family protein n=1 Tax=Paraliobacillus sp. PM-2 TaxID=1462524 RepID=UPI00061CC2BA|nr:amidohydrolase [Paraliobacillus sp. PM-2]CQR45903.1 N-acyl-L-amino acid amidohydrolase [Paraliobacillus sp. PM-2]